MSRSGIFRPRPNKMINPTLKNMNIFKVEEVNGTYKKSCYVGYPGFKAGLGLYAQRVEVFWVQVGLALLAEKVHICGGGGCLGFRVKGGGDLKVIIKSSRSIYHC